MSDSLNLEYEQQFSGGSVRLGIAIDHVKGLSPEDREFITGVIGKVTLLSYGGTPAAPAPELPAVLRGVTAGSRP